MGTLVDDAYLNIFNGKRVLVTGHTGFKGSWLTLLLNLLGADVMGYSLLPKYPNGHFESLGLESNIAHVIGDVRNYELLRSEITSFKPEIVFHLAAQALVKPSYEDPKNTFDINISGGINVLEVVRLCESVRSLVFITSDKCYENLEWIWGYRESDAMGGQDPYSASKGAIEIVFSSYLRSFFSGRKNFGGATARAGNVIGGGDYSPDRIVPDCIRALASNNTIYLRNPNATRPWQHVLEPISGYLKLGARLYESGHAYSGAWNFGPHVGETKTVLDVAKNLTKNFKDGLISFDDQVEHPHEANLLQLNSDKARQKLQWNTRWNFDQTLCATAEWYSDVIIHKKSVREVSLAQIGQFYGGQI